MIVEDGSGIISADSGASVAEADAYFLSRGNAAWAALTTDAKNQSLIQATDFCEKKFGTRFQGTKKFREKFNAQATLTFTGNPSDGDTVEIGTVTYTFVTALGAINDVLIADKTGDSMDNLIAAINETDGDYHTDTEQNEDVEAEKISGRKIVLTCRYEGEDGNDVAVVVTSSVITTNFATLKNGNEIGLPQALSFPRDNCYIETYAVVGVPERYKQAIFELAIRASTADLMPDPEVDPSGRIVTGKTNKVGPIEETVKYSGFASLELLMGSYPGAELLLKPLLGGGGGVSR